MRRPPLFLCFLWMSLSVQICLGNEDIHKGFDDLLKKYVKNGRVDYAAFRGQHKELEQYVQKLAGVTQDEFEHWKWQDRMAFYLNVYNALTIKYVLEAYPVSSIKKIPGVWKKKEYPVHGVKMTLDHIEHQILRREFSEPKIHFGLICAAKGCPEISSEAFVGSTLEKQLEKLTRKFILDTQKNRVDVEKKTVYFSKIFSWFGADFGVKQTPPKSLITKHGEELAGVLSFISNFVLAGDSDFLLNQDYKVKFLDYDWSLNDRK